LTVRSQINVGTAQMASRVGLVFGDPDTQLFGMTVEEDVAFGLLTLGSINETIMERITRGHRRHEASRP